MIIDIMKSVLFGIVEGITEWLPVSSTGHMILLNEFVTMNVKKEFWDMFLVVIQLGAILAVVLLYWHDIWPLHRGRGGKHDAKQGPMWILDRKVLRLWAKTIVACVPAAVVGLALDDWIDAHFYNWVCVSVMLILVGIAFLVIENRNRKTTPRTLTMDDITYREAFLIGMFQLIAAVFPGTSRSGSTILGALMIGVSRPAAANFTFILAIPVMAGASLLKLLKHGLSFTAPELVILLTGMITAFISSILIIKFLLAYIRKHDFKPFGWYRIVLGAVVILCFTLGK